MESLGLAPSDPRNNTVAAFTYDANQARRFLEILGITAIGTEI